MEVEGGISMDKAEYVCNQFGAHLIDIRDVEEKWKVFKYFKEEVMDRQCYDYGKAFWIGNTYERSMKESSDNCVSWIADPYFARSLQDDNYVISNVSCSLRSFVTNDTHTKILVHPICEKDIEETSESDVEVNRLEDVVVVEEPSILKSVFTALFSISSKLFRLGNLDLQKEKNDCLLGYTKLTTGCYLFTKQESDAYEADKFCQRSGGKVLSIDSRLEANEINDYLLQIRRSKCHEEYGWWINDTEHLLSNTHNISTIR